jgi:hypothetical protein
MKLELKHLAPYTLYGLKGQLFNNIDIVTGVDFEHGIIETMNNNNCLIENFKPILIPLSYFSGSRTGKDVMVDLECDLGTVHELWDLYDGSKILDRISIKTYNVMCKNHIDFNRLIEKGLAIYINTL